MRSCYSCGDNCCSPGQECCADGTCCSETCDECIDHGELTGGTVDFTPDPVCLGDTLTFTVNGVVDSGGQMRENCVLVDIAPGTIEYTWEITKPDSTTATGSGSSADVVADQAGGYSCTFTASVNRVCPPGEHTVSESFNPCNGSGTADCPVNVELQEITFTGDHTMYESAAPFDQATPPEGWGAGSAFTGADWKSTNNPDHPICYTRGTGMVVQVKVEVEATVDGTGTLRVVGPDGVSGTTDLAQTCGTEERTVTITATNFPSVVAAYEPMDLYWSIKRAGSTAYVTIGVTQHDTYITYDTPAGSKPTNPRMSFLCNGAAGKWDAPNVTDAIHGLFYDPPGQDFPPIGGHDPAHQSDDWELMAGLPYQGECDEQARFMNRCIQLVGVGAGTEYLTFASTDANPTDREFTTAAALGITVDLDGDGIVGETDEELELIFDFNPPPGLQRSWNNFEGSIVAAGKYYAVWPNLKADTACELLLQLDIEAGAKQYWIYRGPTGGIAYHYPTMVPYPMCP